MAKLYQAGATQQRTTILIRDATTLLGKTGLAFDTAGLAFSYRNGAGGAANAITLATQTVGGAWVSGGFVEIDSVKMPGAYQFDIPNGVLASGVGITEAVVQWKGTGVFDDGMEIDLTSYDPSTVDKTGFSLSTAGVLAIWSQLLSGLTIVGSIGKKLTDWVLGSDNKAVLSNNAHTGAVIPSVTTVGTVATVTTLSQLTQAGVVDGMSIVQAQKVVLAMLAGLRSGLTSDGSAGTAVVRDTADTLNRVTISHDGKGNLLAVTFDLS